MTSNFFCYIFKFLLLGSQHQNTAVQHHNLWLIIFSSSYFFNLNFFFFIFLLFYLVLTFKSASDYRNIIIFDFLLSLCFLINIIKKLIREFFPYQIIINDFVNRRKMHFLNTENLLFVHFQKTYWRRYLALGVVLAGWDVRDEDDLQFFAINFDQQWIWDRMNFNDFSFYRICASNFMEYTVKIFLFMIFFQ